MSLIIWLTLWHSGTKRLIAKPTNRISFQPVRTHAESTSRNLAEPSFRGAQTYFSAQELKFGHETLCLPLENPNPQHILEIQV